MGGTPTREEMDMDDLRCTNERDTPCTGEVTYWLRPSDWTSWAKCPKHLAEAVREHERIVRTYGLGSDTPPAWFDPADAGEEW